MTSSSGVLDRDQARAVLTDYWRHRDGRDADAFLDRLAGCVQPATGVTLTPEEQMGVEWLLLQMTDVQKREAPSAPWRGLRALAARLEAAS